MFRLSTISLDNIHEYLVVDKSLSNEPEGVLKRKINGYQIFKEGFGKKIRVKGNLMCE